MSEFVPELGRLYLWLYCRKENGDIEMRICFRDNPNSLEACRCIGRIDSGCSQVLFESRRDFASSFFQTDSDSVSLLGESVVIRQLCSDEMLTLFARLSLCGGQRGFGKWIDLLQADAALLEEEKDRIHRAFSL